MQYDVTKTNFYLYDNDGNIAGKKIFELDSTGTHTQHPSETISYSYTPSNNVATENGAKRALLYSDGNETIEYDAYGNPTNYLGRTMTWTGRLLTKVIDKNSQQTEMTYDCNGLRIKKGNRTYYWCDGKLVTERKTENGATKTNYYLYDESGVCGMISNGVPYYFRKNITGDVVAIYTATGSLVCRYVYNAWGEQRIYDGNGNTLEDDGVGVWSINPFRYRGYYWDGEFGLYYLQSRYYDPAVGRFISPDDIEYLDPTTVGGLNLYAYCGNNPVMYADPSGEFPILAIVLGITALLGMGLTIGGVASDNNTLTAIGLTMVAVPALISGGMAIVAGVGGATLTGIVGGVTSVAGLGSGLFASAEYQEAFTGNNWMLDAGMSEGWYNGLMLATAAIATAGTFASSFCYNFNIKSIDKIGKLIPSNHPNKGYFGIRFKNSRGAIRSLELHNHAPHGLHFQLNSWNPMHMSVKTIRRWTWFLTRM